MLFITNIAYLSFVFLFIVSCFMIFIVYYIYTKIWHLWTFYIFYFNCICYQILFVDYFEFLLRFVKLNFAADWRGWTCKGYMTSKSDLFIDIRNQFLLQKGIIDFFKSILLNNTCMWGNTCKVFTFLLQKRAVRILTGSQYDEYYKPLFKSERILNVWIKTII